MTLTLSRASWLVAGSEKPATNSNRKSLLPAASHESSRPLWEQLHAWLALERGHVPDGSATAKAIDYSLNHWPALTNHLLNGEVSIDNNSIENLVRPWAMACS